MRTGTPSKTSFFVALARGVGIDRSIDPLAKTLLPPGGRAMIGASDRQGVPGRVARAFWRGASFGFVDHLALRTLVIDHHVRQGVAAGCKQLVVLGAGLDARAYRMAELKNTTVFEVDHPDTQRYKREHIRGVDPLADVQWVEVDFLKERFSDRLLQAGFDSSEPTIWVWEGVAMYLPFSTSQDSVAQMKRLGAANSRLIMSYMVPDALPFGRVGAVAVRVGFAALGEALGDGFDPRTLQSWFNDDWSVTFDAGPKGWLSLTQPPGGRAVGLFSSERVAVARKRAS